MDAVAYFRVGNNSEVVKQQQKQLNVAAYCRVSTDEFDQINSYESQKLYFEELILRNIGWNLVDIYADEGVTGTNTKKRTDFNRMINDAMNGKIDLILTKEVSRFARNTVDTLEYTRQLKKKSVYVIFTNDNIDTRDNDSEFRLTMMASVAQEESRKTSERVKWGVKRKMENGFCYSPNLLGYNVSKGKITINPEGANLVRRIFDMFLYKNITAHSIAQTFNYEGIPTPGGGKLWHASTITRLLRNEKYVGDLVQAKTYIADYLEHRSEKNSSDKYICHFDHHEGIVSREEWERVQDILTEKKFNSKPHKVSNSYWDSGKIFCGICGHRYTPRIQKLQSGSHLSWRCFESMKNGQPKVLPNGAVIGCKNSQVSERAIRKVLSFVYQIIIESHDKIERDLMKKIADSNLDVESIQEQIESTNKEIHDLQDKIKKLVDLYLDGVLSREDIKEKKEAYNKQIAEAETKLNKLTHPEQVSLEINERIDTINKRIKEIVAQDEYDQSLYQNTIDHIIIFPSNEVHVYLKGVEKPFKIGFKTSGRKHTYNVECSQLS